MIQPAELTKPLIPLDSSEIRLDSVGGKAMNLAKLARAGFPVPKGFFIPTSCYRAFLAENNLAPFIKAVLDEVDPTLPESLNAASTSIRDAFAAGSVSQSLAHALETGWRWLGGHPVAVRSSATAEDLPEMSFAGQQDTFLNLVGDGVIREAVVKCWSSLWTARAIGYRARNRIPHGDVSLCVVVQNMVQSDASGVLFTANPLTGCRTETVVEATLGLGEALVGGQVEPDYYLVDSRRGVITQKVQGSKSLIIRGESKGGVAAQKVSASGQAAVPAEVILELASIGQDIETLYGSPQDIEWAYGPALAGDQEGIHILQSRPITTLFPLPPGLPLEPLKCLIGFHAIQGLVEPVTPLGQEVMKLVLTGGGRIFKLGHTLETQTAFYSAAERLWINITAILRSPVGHKVFPNVIQSIDPGIARAAQELVSDPRFSPVQVRPNLRTVRRLAGFMLPFIWRVLRTLHNPSRMREIVNSAFDGKVKVARESQTSTGDFWRDFAQRLSLLHEAQYIFSDFVIPKGVPLVVAGMAPFFGILERFSREVAEATGEAQLMDLYMEIARGLPHNVTTEMDLALWETAQVLRADPLSAPIFESSSAAQLAALYHEGALPAAAQRSVFAFLDSYGMRGIGEIDIGRTRWNENPVHVMAVLQSYLRIEDSSMAPDAVFARGAQAAGGAAERLIAEVRRLPGGRIKARMVRFAVGRYRAIAGMREAPKFFAVRMLSVIRQGLLESGREFTQAGLLDRSDDLFFLNLKELDEAAANRDFDPGIPGRIRSRRALRQREMLRIQIPRVLLSDGTAFYEGITPPSEESDVLAGAPVSPGVAEGLVRVVFDPQETRLEPGEILVCPGTDPAWTPLFLSAAGLVTEVGGMMTHGSVVAREYGIPAVVGVHQATTRLETGQRIRIDGSTGRIILLHEAQQQVIVV